MGPKQGQVSQVPSKALLWGRGKRRTKIQIPLAKCSPENVTSRPG